MGKISKIYVGNEGSPKSPIWFVGEAPGGEEEVERKPFIGPSGDILTRVMSRNGLNRGDCYITNLSHYRPQKNDFELLHDSEELKLGLAEINSLALEHKPTTIVGLGKWALYYLAGKTGITKYRGSILRAHAGGRLIPTFHPAAVLRDSSLYPVFDRDIKRVVDESKHRELLLPQRKFILYSPGLGEYSLWNTDPENPYGILRDNSQIDIQEVLRSLRESPRNSVDIETVKESSHILCVGFAATPSLALCLIADGSMNYRLVLSDLLTSNAKKSFQFGIFDTTILEDNGFFVNNYTHDTLIAQHVLEPELPRGLDFLTSTNTREPYYKQEGRGEIPGDSKAWSRKVNREKLYVYNCRDAATQVEITIVQEPLIAENSDYARLFEFEIKCNEMAKVIGNTGIMIDVERKQKMYDAVELEREDLQTTLDAIAGKPINVKSIKLKNYLYDELKLPERKDREGKRKADEDALISLMAFCKDKMQKLKMPQFRQHWEVKFMTIEVILAIRNRRQLLSNYLGIPISTDGRLRSIYKVAATETGRWAGESYWDDTGCNPQTFPRKRVIEISI